MGKPYSREYHFKGSGTSCGEMICAACRQPIFNETQDWRAYKKSCPEEDWRYVTHHRKCCTDDPQWERLESYNRNIKAEYAAMERDFAAFKEKWKHRENWIYDIVNPEQY